MANYFGTDGIRGVAGVDLTAEFAYHVGHAIGRLIAEEKWDKRVIIGRDSRISGPMLESSITAGLMASGCDAHIIGIVPTPVIAFLTQHLGFPIGCVISASHNPIEDNGIKFFDRRGMKIDDDLQDRIEALLKPRAFRRPKISGTQIGTRHEWATRVDEYVKHINDIGQDYLTGTKVIIDSAYGAAYALAPSVFRLLGAVVTPLNSIPDGSRINVNCGATNVQICRDVVLRSGANMGVALDGDADRAILIDEKGNAVDGDQILAMWGVHLLRKRALPDNSVVGTVLSNKGLEVALEQAGGKLHRAPVGDKYVLQAMITNGSRIGGEQSGHLIFLDHHTTGDGILTAVMVGILMRETGLKLSGLGAMMTRYPQVQLNITVRDKKAALEDKSIESKIRNLSMEIEKIKGRLLVRPSGTESVIRVMTEAPEEAEARHMAEQVIALFKVYSENGLVTEI
jgi:phosphoglucosamine mutase